MKTKESKEKDALKQGVQEYTILNRK